MEKNVFNGLYGEKTNKKNKLLHTKRLAYLYNTHLKSKVISIHYLSHLLAFYSQLI